MRQQIPLLFCCLLSCFPLPAQSGVKPIIHLDGEDHDAVRGWSGAPPTLCPPGAVPGRPSLFLVQFGEPTRASWLDALRAGGLDVLQYLPRFSYFVYGTPESLAAARLRAPILHGGLFPPSLKIAPDLRGFILGSSSTGKSLDLVLQLFDVGDSGVPYTK